MLEYNIRSELENGREREESNGESFGSKKEEAVTRSKGKALAESSQKRDLI